MNDAASPLTSSKDTSAPPGGDSIKSGEVANAEENDPLLHPSRSGRWAPSEHALFLDGVEKFGKDWKAVSGHVGTRTIVQVRTHAQKYFAKLEAKALGTDGDGKLRTGSRRSTRNRTRSQSLQDSISTGASTVADNDGKLNYFVQAANSQKRQRRGWSPSSSSQTLTSKQPAMKPQQLPNQHESIDTIALKSAFRATAQKKLSVSRLSPSSQTQSGSKILPTDDELRNFPPAQLPLSSYIRPLLARSSPPTTARQMLYEFLTPRMIPQDTNTWWEQGMGVAEMVGFGENVDWLAEVGGDKDDEGEEHVRGIGF